MSSESERIEEVGKYIEATIAEIENHTENMEKLFKMDRWSKDSSLYEIIINSYERHRNTLKRIQKMIEGGKVESGLYNNASEVIRESLRFVETHEEWINELKLARLREQLQEGMVQLDQGDGMRVDSKANLDDLFEDLKA